MRAALEIRLRRRASFQEKLRQLLGKYTSKKGAGGRPFRVLDAQHSLQILALRELERLARLGAAVLLALDHARVAGEKAALFQDAAGFRSEIGTRLGDAVTHGARLARQTAAGHGADHVVLAGTGGCDQRLLDHHPQHWTRE